MELNRECRNRPTHIWATLQRQFSREKTVFSTSGTATTEYPYEKSKFQSILYTIHKIYIKIDRRPHVSHITIKTPNEIGGKSL